MDSEIIDISTINFNENSQTIAFEKSVSSILRNEKAEITLPDKDIKVEGEIGFYRQKKFKVVKLLEYTKRIKLLVGHGQTVEKNEVIAQNLSLSGRIFSESFTSPVDGYIDLSMKKDGIMLIWSQNDGKTELDISKFGKYIGGQNGKFHKFETKTTIVPIDLVLNRPVSGFFVKQIEGDFKGLPKILMLSYSDLKNFKTEQLLNDYVRGLLFDHLTFAQIEKMNKTRSEIFTLFTVAAIDGFSDEINQIFFHEIISSIGLMAVLNGNAIEFINSDIKSGSKLFEDKLVKYISYDSKFRYYVETIKIGLDKVLLSNSRDVKEANICNLLYIEDGIKK